MHYRTVWRWHFYASLFCMPFVIVLSITGAIYLFKPQLDRLRDRAYDGVVSEGKLSLPSEQIRAVLSEFPDHVPAAYELRTASSDAVRIIMQQGSDQRRVFVDPVSLKVLGSRSEEGGSVRLVRTIHGQLGMGERGSNLVELASSWTIIMVLTGLFLWWPRSSSRWAGVIYPRLWKGRKLFWRDLHSVTGVWISLLVLFLLVTGLPWAKFWGNYLKTVRSLTGTAVAKTDWTIGGVAPAAASTGSDEHAGHGEKKRDNKGGRRGKASAVMPEDLTDFDRLVALAEPMKLAYPATISPPAKSSLDGQAAAWIIKSDAQNRPLRVTLEVLPKTGEILSRDDFASKHWIDRLVAIGIAAHEGQLFGIANQALGVITAAGLVLLCVSGTIMWWRRREPGTLGAPAPAKERSWSFGLLAIILALGLYLPLFGLSLILVLVVERLFLIRIPCVNRWLGLLTVDHC